MNGKFVKVITMGDNFEAFIPSQVKWTPMSRHNFLKISKILS